MADKGTITNQQEKILKALILFPEGASIEEIQKAADLGIDKRQFQRRLNTLIEIMNTFTAWIVKFDVFIITTNPPFLGILICPMIRLYLPDNGMNSLIQAGFAHHGALQPPSEGILVLGPMVQDMAVSGMVLYGLLQQRRP